jgi:hypothetical protein
MFIGPGAKTFDVAKMAAAQKLEALGHTPSDIRDMTGMFKGADGNWRSEISDAGATMKGSISDFPYGARVGDVLQHAPLYEAYPDLKHIILRDSGGPHGQYSSPSMSDSGRPEISVGGSIDEQKSVLLHELMHAIQDKEGFAPGGNPSWYDRAIMSGSLPYDPIDKIGTKFTGSGAMDMYKQNAGEVEARNVQARMHMTPDELAQEYNSPWLTQDFPNSKQIVERPGYDAIPRAVGGLGKGLTGLLSDATDAETAALKARLEAEAAQASGLASGLSKSKETYAGQHSAPDASSGSPLHDVTLNGIYPKDFYGPNGLKYYGTGDEALDASTYQKILAAKDNPDASVRIWRAVPWDGKGRKPVALGGQHLNPGDWVTLSKQYAIDHGESALNGNYALIATNRPARELYTSGDSFHEWGWSPPGHAQTGGAASGVTRDQALQNLLEAKKTKKK